MTRVLKINLVLTIFYVVGFIGITQTAFKDIFLSLTFFTLLLSFFALWLTRNKKKEEWYMFVAFVYVLGFFVEWIGVHFGLLFGNYGYGDNLGPKVSGIPIIIGVNWLIVSVTAASIAKKWRWGIWLRPFIGALLMVGFDYILEPVAINSDFWIWENGVIPFYNYVCWFAIGLLIQVVYHFTNLNESNKVNDYLLVLMTVFFVSLNLF